MEIKDPTYMYKMKIARMAYREVRDVIDKIEKKELLIDVLCHWDGCISVDDQIFHEHQLRERIDDVS